MENSKIEWTDHTFNPWWGCMKVSEGCKNCYAESQSNRFNSGLWGLGSIRKPMSEEYWLNPFKWDDDARTARVKSKVFCASMADIFEDPRNAENSSDVSGWRRKLFRIIENTPNLIWQLLTKRPENVRAMVPLDWQEYGYPDNVWIGTSVENQKAADERIPRLLQIPAKVRFLSCEPLLGSVDLSEVFGLYEYDESKWSTKVGSRWKESPDWVICGGESGPKARPMHPDWARLLRDQCEAAGVPFFFKQNGEYVSVSEVEGDGDHHKFSDGATVRKIGKKAAGSLLDGKEWKEFPV